MFLFSSTAVFLWGLSFLGGYLFGGYSLHAGLWAMFGAMVFSVVIVCWGAWIRSNDKYRC